VRHRGANGIRIDRVEDVKRRDGLPGAEDLTKHFRGETRSAHAEQHDVREPVSPYRIRARAQPRHLRDDDVERVQPPETIGDQRVNRGIGRPDVETLLPERLGEPELVEAGIRTVDGVSERPWLDRERAQARDIERSSHAFVL